MENVISESDTVRSFDGREVDRGILQLSVLLRKSPSEALACRQLSRLCEETLIDIGLLMSQPPSAFPPHLLLSPDDHSIDEILFAPRVRSARLLHERFRGETSLWNSCVPLPWLSYQFVAL